MKASGVKSLVVVFVLFLLGLITVGCGSQKNGWVNTNSLPGQTFTQNSSAQKQTRTTIVCLGPDRTQEDSNFGPRDVDFNFENLK